MAASNGRCSAIPGRRLQVAMVAYGDISHDSRVLREAASLAEAGHDVTIHCLAADAAVARALPAVATVVRPATRTRVVPGTPSPFRMTGRGRLVSRGRRLVARVGWLAGYGWNLVTWGRSIARAGRNVDVWHLHDFTALAAVAPWLGRDAVIVYDVHDLFLETGSAVRLPMLLRRLIDRAERRLGRRAALVVTVNQALADVLARRIHPGHLVVVHNCPARQPASRQTATDRLRAATGIPAATPVVLYHGLIARNRGLDTLIEAMAEPGLEAAHVVLLGSGELAEALAAVARDPRDPRHGGRLHVLPAVPPDELLSWVRTADVGALAMPRASGNLYRSTPNKLFECLAAGVPVVVSDFPAVRAIVLDDQLGPLGATTDPADPRAVARAIGTLLDLGPGERSAIRRRCARAARERWNWESEVAGLVEAYRHLANPTDRAPRAEAPSHEGGV